MLRHRFLKHRFTRYVLAGTEEGSQMGKQSVQQQYRTTDGSDK